MPQKIEHTHPQTLNIILINTNPPCCKIWTLKTPPLQILYFLSCSNQNITHTQNTKTKTQMQISE